MESITTFLTNVSNLSSDGLFGALFDVLGTAAGWADNVAKLIGLLG